MIKDVVAKMKIETALEELEVEIRKLDSKNKQIAKEALEVLWTAIFKVKAKERQ